MNFKEFAISTPINFVPKQGKSDSLSSVSTKTVNDSGYFTPSPVIPEICLQEDSRSSNLGATPVTNGRLWSFNLENNADSSFTRLKPAFDDESRCCSTSTNQQPAIAPRKFDRLHSNLFKSRKEQCYNTRQNRLVFLHDIGTLVGESRVDFLKALTDLNLGDVTSLIMNSVDDCDLCVMCCASKQWNGTVMSDLMARKRRKKYLEFCTREKENKRKEMDTKAKMCTRKVSRSLLDDILNTHSSSLEDAEKVVNVDPAESELKHYRQFVEVGQRLKPNEMLDKCPRCASPARVNTQQKRAICSLSGCEFDYCTLCRCEYNFRHHCSPVKLRSRKLSIPSKKRSKKFLRRLLS